MIKGNARLETHLGDNPRRLASVINPQDETVAVRAVGALVWFLDKHYPGFSIFDCASFLLNGPVHVSPESLNALMVFTKEGSITGTSKEGFSLYGILAERMKTLQATRRQPHPV